MECAHCSKDYFKDLDNNDYCLGNIHKIKSVGFAKVVAVAIG